MRISLYGHDAFKAYKDENIGFFDCFRYIDEVIKLNELTGEYYGNLAMAYFMTILGSFRNIINALNSSTGKYWIRKMDE